MRRKLSLVFGLVVLLAAASAEAKIRVVADVPFDFRVGNELLPAGRYTVENHVESEPIVVIRSEDRRTSISVQSHAAVQRKLPETGKLLFHRYGRNYFLRGVWTIGNPTGRQLAASKAEKEMLARLGPFRKVAVAADADKKR